MLDLADVEFKVPLFFLLYSFQTKQQEHCKFTVVKEFLTGMFFPMKAICIGEKQSDWIVVLTLKPIQKNLDHYGEARASKS